ncbi:MAG: NAD(P)-binding domain-containing protein, partial [Planctomycetota bacterium]|nr:NAD(P)-binding domain-containing protein [Planctomycetota bacterium]
MEKTSIVLIGAGPIGVEAAVALAEAGLDYVHIEAGQVGSTMQWWAPDTTFFSSPERIAIADAPIPSVDQSKATRESYLAYLRSVVARHDLPIRTYTRVVAAAPHPEGGFVLTLRPSNHGVGGPEESRSPIPSPRKQPGDALLHAEKIILAIGDLQRPRLLDIPGEDLPNCSHFFDDPHRYFRRKVLLVGGKNSAAEA